ncbi:DNA mismatch repair protein mlh1 [Nematocida parisii ERTm1]|uniref:DNA mismatch repair protein mlh1 n=1 Tax=Nematocida parisii (strain ERTm3) TaxID=935791 RepID=I3EGU1_NEMP3|nr:DNA mismatch repair protein mlh1 [Nematocida parisii ERTm1]EIJ88438.1 DNA mismatch repair protein mlh1 [Nematocida parisii ERTm3]EIJ94691.1 DNA mismatch repair protein mlh1 [Nematocida parisii ERTm1]|eukprot:XP_013058047.1 DNA mismatch repair protein mlh1 [Nematocida parisii ERTm1]
MTITLLPKEVIERISAGEVITSPTALIKEVLENSLDSNTTTIRITISDTLLDRIVIEDTGCGINKADLDLLCTKHATSKLSQYNDLYSINTLGFRGEALASISMLSHITVSTSTDSIIGHEVKYEKQKLIKQKEITCKKGTKIEITDLFYNCNKKYKKFINNKTEIIKIFQIISKYSIIYTGVLFEVVKGSELKRYNVRSNKNHTLSEIFTPGLVNELVNIKFSTQLSLSNVHYNMYVSHSNLSLLSPVFILFINKRLVEIKK